jgi:hypothetical protein
MTEEKGEVIEFKSKQEEEIRDVREGMSQEEIEVFMKQEEEELNAHLGKFMLTNVLPDTSSISEDDEEDEIITLDFDKGTATEKILEGAVLLADGKMHVIELQEDPGFAPRIREIVKESTEPTLQQKYYNMVVDRFVSKAIAQLIEKFNEVIKQSYDMVSDGLPAAIGDHLAWDVSDRITKQKRELQLAIAGGHVNYDKIPDWAKSHIDEYIYSALGTLIDFVQRD